jgi:predicted acylesterase/phospholipase RssA
MFDRMFEDRALEDLWVPCFATTVDLNGCRLVGHTRGEVARWVRASASPPGIWPPVVADDGSLHVDGGVLDNLPVQIMRQTGPGRIATVNVSPYQPMLFRGTGTHAGGSLRLLPGLLGAGRQGPSPNIVRILYRTVVVTSLNTQARAKAGSDFYIEPKVGAIALTDYDRIDDIVAAGYDAARRELDRSGASLR